MVALHAREVDPTFPKQAIDHQSPLPSSDENRNGENNLSTLSSHLRKEDLFLNYPDERVFEPAETQYTK